MIERPPSRGLNADDTACQRPLAGIIGSVPRDLQLVNEVPRRPRDLDDVEQVEFGELIEGDAAVVCALRAALGLS